MIDLYISLNFHFHHLISSSPVHRFGWRKAMALGNYPWQSTKPGRSRVFDWVYCLETQWWLRGWDGEDGWCGEKLVEILWAVFEGKYGEMLHMAEGLLCPLKKQCLQLVFLRLVVLMRCESCTIIWRYLNNPWTYGFSLHMCHILQHAATDVLPPVMATLTSLTGPMSRGHGILPFLQRREMVPLHWHWHIKTLWWKFEKMWLW